VTLVTLLGCAALAVDIGYIYLSHGEMQAAVDAGALAGVTAAPYNSQTAVLRAKQMAGTNWVAGSAVAAREVQVQVGYWNSHGNTFSLPTGTEIAEPNAAHVVGSRTGVPLFFASILGRNTTDVARAATANYGAGICAGIWGLEGIDGDGSIYTDSYDSSAGNYAPGNIYLNGDLCSDQDVILEGGVDIGGDVRHGDGYDLTLFGTSYSIAGITGPQNASVPIPNIDMVAAAANNDNATIPLTDVNNRDPFGGTTWDLTNVRGQDTLTLNGGTYYMTSGLLEGGAQIIITAPTTFYIDGPADFSGGGIINATKDPSNLIIYSTGPTLTIDGDAGFYGAVIAPTTTVTFTGGSQIYGTVLARYVQMAGDVQIHVDSDTVNDLFAIGPEAPVLVE
jgi:Flp pilus assembly protein TadG